MTVEVVDKPEAQPFDIDMFSQECVCGSSAWNIWVAWDDDREIASYSKEMYCVECNTKALTPPFDPRFDEE